MYYEPSITHLNVSHQVVMEPKNVSFWTLEQTSSLHTEAA